MEQEKTINRVIGMTIQVDSFADFGKVFNELIDSIRNNYNNITEEEFIKGLLVKYGFIDLTYKEADGDGFIRLFGKTEKCGAPFFYSNDPNFDERNYFKKYTLDIESVFPLEFEIIDCCMTTDRHIWEEKYFYV